jgi:type II secretory pathway pseudopilin PulG
MNPAKQRRIGRESAFTLTDILAILAIVAVVGAIVAATVVTMKRKSRLTLCISNLQQVNRAVILYSDDNHKTLPAPSQDHSQDIWWWYKEKVKRYAGLNGPSSVEDKVFACPDDRGYSDPKPFYKTARFDYGSYVFNGVNLPGAPNIAAWQVPSVKQPNKTLLTMEFPAHAPLSWHKSKTGKENHPFYNDAQSVVGFVDGHVNFLKIYYDGYTPAFMRDPIPGYDYKYSGN